MNNQPPQLVIFASDVARITGLNIRTALRLLNKIKKKLNRDLSGFVTVEEFCEFTELREEKVRQFLK